MKRKQAALRVIAIVGANRGIGYYMVKRLLELGDSISVLDIETDNLKELRERYPDKLITITADAAKDEDIKNGVSETIKQFGKIDIAVHNACLCTFESESHSDYELYNKVMDINFFGALRLSKAVLPEMRKQGFGKIIFTCSGVGVTGFGNISPYASSKGAMEALAKCLEIENQKYGISFHLFHHFLGFLPLLDNAVYIRVCFATPLSNAILVGEFQAIWMFSFIRRHGIDDDFKVFHSFFCRILLLLA